MLHDVRSYRRWAWRIRYDLLFCALVVFGFIWRLVPLLGHGSPVGSDWGNDLIVGHDFLGHTVGDQGLTYPPIMPLAVALLNYVVPLKVVTSVIGAIAGVVPYAGIYFALRTVGSSLIWAIAPLPLLISSSTSELVAFGGAPQAIANGCFPIVMVAAALLLDHPTRRRALIFGVSVFILAGLSEEVFGQLVICLIVLLLLEVMSQPRSALRRVRESLPYFGISLSPLLLLVPIYVPLVKQLGFNQTVKAAAIYTPKFNWTFLTREDHLFWNFCLCVAIFVAYYAMVHVRNEMGPLLRASFSILLTSIVFIMLVPEIRFSYLLPVGVCFALALMGYFVLQAIHEIWNRQSYIFIAVVITLAFTSNVFIQFYFSTAMFTQQVIYYGAFSPTALDMNALQFIQSHTPSNSLFAVTSVTQADSQIGEWVEGYAERPALLEGNPSLLYYASQKRESKIATEIFALFPSEQTFRIANKYDVKFLVIFRTWALYQPMQTKAFVTAHSSLVVFSNSDVLILKVKPYSS